MTRKRAKWLRRCRGRICVVHRWMVLVPRYVTLRCTNNVLTVRIVGQRFQPPGAAMAEWISSSSIFLSFPLSMFAVECGLVTVCRFWSVVKIENGGDELKPRGFIRFWFAYMKDMPLTGEMSKGKDLLSAYIVKKIGDKEIEVETTCPNNGQLGKATIDG